MDYGIKREEALTLLNESIQNENLIKHCQGLYKDLKNLEPIIIGFLIFVLIILWKQEKINKIYIKCLNLIVRKKM